MRIYPVSYGLNFQSNTNFKKQEVNSKNCPKSAGIYPTTAQALSFMGGKSMSLKETRTQIENFGKFPPDIKENIEHTLRYGNPDDKTLIDIHREKYSLLNELETLDEIKEFYPEFEGVLSDSEVDYQEGSFIDDVKNDKIPYFDSKQDLAVQLLQMYWGDGFSLNDLRDQFAGKNLNYTMEKLNIPKVNKVYGHYLKFSDKDYNERFTKSMSERLKEVERRKIEQKEGVFIPRGPLSDEHKEKISKGLMEFYAKNPDRLAEMSKRHLEYYENNPKECEKMSQVMLRAWSYRDADSIKKALSKFIKKKNISNEELVSMSKNKNFAEFWKRNSWARDKFSKCMLKSWERQKELDDIGLIYEPICVGTRIPKPIVEEIERMKGLPKGDLVNALKIYLPDKKEGLAMINNAYIPHEEFYHANRVITNVVGEDSKMVAWLMDSVKIGTVRSMMIFAQKYNKSNGKECPNYRELLDIFFNMKTKFAIDELTGTKLDLTPLTRGLAIRNLLQKIYDVSSLKILDKEIEKAAVETKNLGEQEKANRMLDEFNELCKYCVKNGIHGYKEEVKECLY